MKKMFICLANSKKYTERCIAGIELAKSPQAGYTYQIIRQDGNPVWIRPVSDSEYGAVSPNLVDHIKLLDIVEVNITQAAPQGYQSENALCDNQCLTIIDTLDKSVTILDKLLPVEKEPFLFSNKHKSVHVDKIGQLTYSLVLIKPLYVLIFEKDKSPKPPQVRARFIYGNISYDLPVTDIEFIERFKQDPKILAKHTHIYFTVSLGMAFEARHYKLVAGVIYF